MQLLNDSNIRTATRADITAILAVRTSVKENQLNHQQLAERGITEQSLAGMIESSQHGCWCVEVDGRLAGFSMADQQQSNIFALFVRPEYEGSGLGSALLQAAIDWLSSAGQKQINLSTDPGTRAFEFYLRQGWKHVGLTEQGEAKFKLQL